MYTTFTTVKVDDTSRVMDLGEEAAWRLDLLPKLFIRVSYERLANLLLASHAKDHLLLGTPGVGKSQFFAFFAARLLESAPNTGILYHTESTYVFLSSGYNVELSDTAAVFALLEGMREAGRDVWYIIDATNPVPRFCSASSKSLLITSPNKDIYHDYSKRDGVSMLYMPLWDWDELLRARASCYPQRSVAQMKALFEKFGRSARIVLSDYDAESRLQDALSTATSSEDLRKVYDSLGATTTKDSVSHILLHIDADPVTFKRMGYVFASKQMEQLVLNQMEVKGRQDVVAWLKQNAKHPLAGFLFEPLVHRVFGGQTSVKLLQCRQLTGKDLGKVESLAVVWTKQQIFTDLPASPLDTATYYVPSVPNLASIDGFWRDGCLQATVSGRHSIKGKYLIPLVKTYRIKKLFFVVPEENFATFQKQPFVAENGKVYQKLPKELEESNLTQFVVQLTV